MKAEVELNEQLNLHGEVLARRDHGESAGFTECLENQQLIDRHFSEFYDP